MIYMASVYEALQLLGVSKLFTYFRKDNSYNKIFTFFFLSLLLSMGSFSVPWKHPYGTAVMLY